MEAVTFDYARSFHAVINRKSSRFAETAQSRSCYSSSSQVLPITSRWHKVAANGACPIGRRSHSAFVHNGCLYIFGGYNGAEDRHFNTLHKFDPATFTWTNEHTRGSGPKPRRRQCCIVDRDRLFLFGGTSPKENRDGAVAIDDDAIDVDEPDLTDHADLYILDFAPKLKTLCILALVRYCRPDLNRALADLPFDLRWEVLAMTKNNKIATAPFPRSENSSG